MSKKPRIDLSVAQVAGSAVAAIVAAVLASKLGVYGTFIGAGVVSVVATSGGTIFQHFFRRTGEQIREVTVHAKPRARQVGVRVAGDGGGATRTRVLRTATVPTDLADDEFSAATTHGTRVRGWKRSVIAAAVVFGIAMGGITTYELVSGGDLSGGAGSTVSNVLRGGGGDVPNRPSPPSTAPVESPGGGSPTPPDAGVGGGGSPSPGPGSGESAGSGAVPPDGRETPPAADGGATGEATPTPTPTPSGSAEGSVEGDAESPGAGGDAERESPAP